jgi:hypothetical protein
MLRMYDVPVRMHGIFALVAALPLCASAQDPAVQRELLQRDQQSDAFRLQLRQWQERIAVPPAEPRLQQETEARHFAERHGLDGISDSQLRDLRPDAPAQLRPYERQKAAQERTPFLAPY